MPDAHPHQDGSEKKVWLCAGCRSWTAEPVAREELLREWGWTADEEDPGELYCAECS